MGLDISTYANLVKGNLVNSKGVVTPISVDELGRVEMIGTSYTLIRNNYPETNNPSNANFNSSVGSSFRVFDKGTVAVFGIRGIYKDSGKLKDALYCIYKKNTTQSKYIESNYTVSVTRTGSKLELDISGGTSDIVDIYWRGGYLHKALNQFKLSNPIPDKLNDWYICYSLWSDKQYVSGVVDIGGDDKETTATTRFIPSGIPVFNVEDYDSIYNYLTLGDRSGEIYTGKKGTDWTIYQEFLKNNTIFTFKWKNEYIDYLIKNRKIAPDAVKTSIEVQQMGTLGDWKNLKTTNYKSKYTTNVHEILRLASPKYYQSLVNGNIFTVTAPIIDVRFKNFSIDGSGRVLTNYGYFQIVVNNLGEWYIQNAQILPDDNPDESTITIIEGSGETEDDYEKVPDDSDVGTGTGSGSGSSSLALLTHTYAMTEGRLKALGGFLWGDLLTSLKLVNTNPIENVVSCKIIPAAVSGPDTAVYLGNVDTGVVGGLVSNNLKISIGNIRVSGYYNNFLDYAPYTKITIFIPFIGFKELDTSLFMGKTLKVEYIIDLITGACKALLFANDIYCQSFDGVCGIDIPLTSNNRAQVEASYVMGALGTAVSAASGNIAGVATSMLMSAMTPFHYSTKGTYSPSCGSFETRLCYLVIDRPTFQYPSTYRHDKGLPCQLSRSLGSLSGFTVCDGSVDLSGISCTEAEKEMLRNELTTGVYL